MRVLVTGAGGFVGRRVVRALAAAGHDARALVRPRRPAPAAGERIEVVRGDVTSPLDAAAALSGCDAVVHVAGLIKALDEAAFARVNVYGARVVAEAASRAGAIRLVLVSSLAARGPHGARGPVSAYGRTKRAGEDAVRAAAPGADVVIVRPTAVYGPGDAALLPLFRLARLGFRPVLAGASGRLTFVQVDDLARALVRLAVAGAVPPGSPGDPPGPLEASDGSSYTWDEVSRLLAQAVGRPGRPHRVPSRLFVVAAWGADLVARVTGVPQVFGRDKLADMRGDWSAEPARFWDAAGEAPRLALAEGLAETARAYREAGVL